MSRQPSRVTTTWSLELRDPPTTSPLLLGDDVLVSTRDTDFAAAGVATVHSIDGTNGRLRWQKQFSRSSVSSLLLLPSLGPLLLIAVSSHDLLRGRGAIVALDPDGNEVWTWSGDVQTVSALAARDDDLFFATDSGFLVIIDSRKGNEWKRFPLDPPPSVAAPLVHDGFVYVPCRSPTLVAHAVTGEFMWEFDAGDSGWLDRTPLAVGERVMATSSAGIAVALDADSGTVAWQRQIDADGTRLSAPTTDGERLYVGAQGGLHVLDVTDGRPLWRFPTGRPVEAQPVLRGSAIYIVSHDHNVYALDAANGTELWRHEMGRRIEVAPALRKDGKRWAAVVADRGGTVAALAPFAGSQEHMMATQAGDWASAAARYEAEHEWAEAAEMWERVGHLSQKAEALKEYAESLPDTPEAAGKKAAAWEAAAVAFEEGGNWRQADACRRLVAEHRRLPIISLDVEHEELILDAWSRLRFIVRNDGFGPAHRLIIRAEGDRFDGQVTATRTISTLAANRQRVDWLDIRPREYGETVPLRVSVVYEDSRGETHSSTEVIYIAVARSESDQARPSTQILGIFGALRQMTDDEAERFMRLHNNLMQAFSKEELYTLALELGLDYEMLPETKGSFIRELLLHLWRRQRLDDLVALGKARRPHLLWEEA